MNEADLMILAAAGLCALLLAALAILCLHLCRREEEGTSPRVQSTLSGLRRAYEVRQRRQEAPPALIYGEISCRSVRSRLSIEQTEEMRRWLQGALRAWAGREDGARAALADGDGLLILSEMGADQFQAGSRRICEALEQYSQEHGLPVRPEVHLGYYRGRDAGISFDEAVRRAARACRCAAADGVNCRVYDYGQAHLLERAAEMEKTIVQSIRENRFLLEFQPFVELETGRVVGGEVLSRLRGEDQGLLMPERFLAAVDTTDAHGQFDYYVFQKACAWLSGLTDKKELRYLSCNFSRRTLSEERFAHTVLQIADRYGLPHRMLAIEVTEEEGPAARETMERNLEQLHQAGFSIFLDDFGAGVTSLNDLRRLPLDVVKLDKSLLDGAQTPRGLALFRNAARMAADLGLLVLCEGMEEEEQAQCARQAGCVLGQGYYYYQPLSAPEFVRLLPGAAESGPEGEGVRHEAAASGRGRLYRLPHRGGAAE